jgi:hypothetical protein
LSIRPFRALITALRGLPRIYKEQLSATES